MHTEESPRGLREGVVGLVGAATLGVVMLSPAMTLYGNFGAAYAAAGPAAPLTFVWALFATLPTAVSYALVAREQPSSGSAASWTALAVSPRVARWVGWIVFCYYLFNFVMQPVTMGLFVNDLLGAAGVTTSVVTYALGAALCCALSAAIVYRGITPSTQGALGLLLFEALVVAALCVLAVAFNPGRPPLSAHGFTLAAAPGGMPAMTRALIFGVLSYCGFDVVSTLAEETKMARRLIPQATILSLVVFGAFITAGFWALTYAQSPERLLALANGNGMPITEIARGFWGRGSLLVVATGVSAALGIAIATAVGASRILFSMGRDGLAPARFAALHPTHRVPWTALHVIFGAGLVGALAVGAWASPYGAYVWWGATSTFFALVTFVFVNLSNLLLHRDRLGTLRGAFLHGALPVAGVAIDVVVLWRSFFVELWSQPWATGRSVIVFDVACATVALAALFISPGGDRD